MCVLICYIDCHILKDVEEEALKLRTMKKYGVSRAHLLLQTITVSSVVLITIRYYYIL